MRVDLIKRTAYFLRSIVFFGVCCTPSVYATKTLQQKLDQLLSASKFPVHVGAIVRNVKTGKVLYQRHMNYLFSPASVQKLLTATAALTYLKPTFRYATTLMTDGKVNAHVLRGKVGIKFSGDPELTGDDIQQLLDTLKSKGVRQIVGDMYLDISRYDTVAYPPGWLWDDLSYSYAAPLYADVIDKNKFILRLMPAKKLGEKPILSVDIPNHVVRFKNKVKTTAHYNKHCLLTIYSDLRENTYTLGGCLNKDWGRQRRNLALRDPTPYVKAVIRQALADDNIQYKGKIVIHGLNHHYRRLGVHYSVPLRTLVKDMLKKSDNLIADSLLKQLGHQYYKHEGTWQNGVMALEAVLGKPTGIDFKHNVINDGAGLSRYNLLTPRQLSLLLTHVYHKPELRHVVMEALPVAGVDGTLVERMFAEAQGKRVRAKTGSMAGVSSLAGYIYTRHIGVLSFVLLFNGFVGKHGAYTRIEDRVCEYLAGYRGSSHG